MPNHVMNEVKIKCTEQEQKDMLKYIVNEEGKIDFRILLPIPLNCWQGDLSDNEKQFSPYNWYDWCTKNWGTKWNAYGQEKDWYKNVEFNNDELILRFQTAWLAPYGWLIALSNNFKKTIEFKVCDEGNDKVLEYTFEYSGSSTVILNNEESERGRMMSFIYKDYSTWSEEDE